VNDGALGYYHVKYEGDMRRALRDRAQTVLTPAERFAFLADVNALVAADGIDVAEGLELVPVFVGDSDRYVVDAALGLFNWARREFLPEALLPNYARAVNKLLGPSARSLGWKEKQGESNDAKILRAELLPRATIGGEDAPLAAEAKALADRWLRDRSGVDPDLVVPVLAVAATHADRAWFDRCISEARRASDGNERRRILSSLGALRDPALVPDALTLLLGDTFDLRDMRGLLFGLLHQRETREIAYEWVKKHYEALFPRMRDDEQSWLLSIPANFCDEAHRKDAKEFFGPRAEKIDGGPRALERALERVDLCIAAQARNRAGVEAFLKAY
jgi:aminopeptidase N